MSCVPVNLFWKTLPWNNLLDCHLWTNLFIGWMFEWEKIQVHSKTKAILVKSEQLLVYRIFERSTQGNSKLWSSNTLNCLVTIFDAPMKVESVPLSFLNTENITKAGTVGITDGDVIISRLWCSHRCWNWLAGSGWFRRLSGRSPSLCAAPAI